jgi:hypothetical protein
MEKQMKRMVGFLLMVLAGCLGLPESLPHAQTRDAVPQESVAPTPQQPLAVAPQKPLDVVQSKTIDRNDQKPTPGPTKAPVQRNGFTKYGFQVLDGWSCRQRQYGSPVVVGEVRNCTGIPQGVELQVIVRDPNGSVLSEASWWPASILNIGPGETSPFQWPIPQFSGDVQVELRILQAHTW